MTIRAPCGHIGEAIIGRYVNCLYRCHDPLPAAQEPQERPPDELPETLVDPSICGHLNKYVYFTAAGQHVRCMDCGDWL